MKKETKLKKKENNDIFNNIKEKAIEGVSNYINEFIQDKIKTSKKEILNYIEKKIEKKIKNEFKNLKKKIIFYIGLIIGIFFLFYGIIELIFFILNIPNEFVSLVFGLIIILISFIFYTI